MVLYNELLPFQVIRQVGGNFDHGAWCHLAFESKSQFPTRGLEPKARSAAHGSIAAGGVCGRALFVIDREGMISWVTFHNRGQPGADGISAALDGLTASALTRPGEVMA
jgi:hypothetical protein